MRTPLLFLTLVFGLLVAGNASCQVADTNAISNEQFKEASVQKGTTILDVRTAGEFSTGHLPAALHSDVLQADQFKQYIASLPKDGTYLLYCRSGKRSAAAVALMKDAGFTQVKHLRNGISGWDGPVTR